MGNKESRLSLVIKAVDQATAPLRAVNKQIAEATKPIRQLNNGFRALANEAGLPKVLDGFKGVGTAASKVGKEVFALGAKFAGLAALGGLGVFHAAKGVIETGDKLNEMSKRVNMGVDAYASLQFAADQSDVSAEQFNNSMDQFNLRLGQLKNNTGPLKAMPQMFRNQLKGAKDTGVAFDLAVKAIGKMGTAEEKAALARELFGKSGLQFGQFLGQGPVAIAKLRAEFIRLNGSQVALAANSDDADNALKKLETAMSGLQNAGIGALLPAFSKLSEALTEIMVRNRPAIAAWGKAAGDAIKAWVEGGGVERLAKSLKDMATSVVSLIDKVGGLKGLAIGFAVFESAGLLSAVGSLALSFLQLNGALIGMGTTLGAVSLAAAPLALSLGAVAAAIYQITKNWDALKAAKFSEIGAFVGDATGVAPLEGKQTRFGSSLIHGLSGAVGSFNPLLGAGIGALLDTTDRPRFGAADAMPSVGAATAGPVTSGGKSHTVVEFRNAPPGTRLTTTEATGVNLETLLSMGPAMGGQ